MSRPGRRWRTAARRTAALVLALAAGCGPRSKAPPVETEAAPAPEPAATAAAPRPCVRDLASTLTRFDSPPAVAQWLRGSSGPLPLVTYGPLAPPDAGDEHRRQEVRFLTPNGAEQDVYLQIFDVDTGWQSVPEARRPWDDHPEGSWDAVTRFRLLGRDGAVLLEHVAAADRDTPGDQRWTSWGPIPLACGAEEGAGSLLVLEVEGLEGDDGNVFLAGLSTRPDDHVEPPGLRITSPAPTVRLLEARRSVGELRLDIPEGSRRLTVRSFDLARGSLRLETAVRLLPLPSSDQGEAVEASEAIDGDESGAAALLFHGGQDDPNDATFSISDEEGTPLAIRLPAFRRPASVNRPPLARMRQTVADDCRTVSFDAAGSSDPDGDAIRFHWDFGDGAGAEEPRTEHVYAGPGTYRGRLLVSDDSGAVRHAGRRAFERRIWARPVAEAGGGRVGAPGVAVELDGSGSTDPDGGALRYIWSFGDGGGGRGERVTHRWRRPGTYEVTLTVEDDGEAPCHRTSDTLTVAINGAPRAEAGPPRLAVAPGEDIAFDGGGSSDPEGETLAYRWDFGDGGAAEAAAARHRYQRPGTYRAVLTVTDPSGAPNASASDAIEVFVNAPPLPAAAAALPACAAPGGGACFESCAWEVALDASGSSDADGDDLSYTWSFGDGAEASGLRVTHVYAEAGDYAARLTVDDGRGLANSRQTAAVRVRVHPPPVAVAGPPRRVVAAGDPLLLSGAGSTTSGDVALRYHWDFDFQGDAGEPPAAAAGWEPTAVHRYSEPGSEHLVRLTVVDGSGFDHCPTGTAQVRVVVTRKP